MMRIWDVAVERTHLEHRASLVEIELDSRGQLLLLQTEILSERGGKRDGALRDGRASSQAPPASGIPTDLPKNVEQTQSSLTTVIHFTTEKSTGAIINSKFQENYGYKNKFNPGVKALVNVMKRMRADFLT